MKNALKRVGYGGALAAAMVVALPGQAETTASDRLGTPMMVVAPSASAGASTASAGSSSVTQPAAILDPVPADRTYIIQPRNLGGVPWVDVNHGETVLFLVHAPNAPERRVKWLFNGIDNVMSYTDIDPQATFASNVKIYVNQTYSPMQNNTAG